MWFKQQYCKDCNKKLGKKAQYNKTKRCHSCAGIQIMKNIDFSGINNPNYNNHKLVGRNNPMYGKHHTEETKKQISRTRIKLGLSKGRNHPMFGKIVHTKYIVYKSIYFHSSWEVAYAKYLDKNNIKWQYESKTFNLGDCTYTPDFYLSESDTYIEIKGYFRTKDKKKFKLFRKLYKNIKIKLLQEKDLKQLKII